MPARVSIVTTRRSALAGLVARPSKSIKSVFMPSTVRSPARRGEADYRAGLHAGAQIFKPKPKKQLATF